jgi:hypothetical protein
LAFFGEDTTAQSPDEISGKRIFMQWIKEAQPEEKTRSTR